MSLKRVPQRERILPDDLADDTGTFIVQVVEDSAPNPNRPKIGFGVEKKLEESGVEVRMAALKALAKALQQKISRAAQCAEDLVDDLDSHLEDYIKDD